MATIVTFEYRNHRGVTETRTVEVESLEFVFRPNEEYGYNPGWFLNGICQDRKARRSFALTNIIVSEHGRSLLPF